MSEVRLNVGDDYIGSAFSPVVSIEEVEEGHKVTITDYDGDHSYTVPDWSVEEDGRVANEQARQAAEAARASAETSRVAAETSRASAESARASAEASRASAETSRQSAEAARVTTFETNEAARQATFETNEDTRQEDETARVSAESARATAESARASAETARASAETARASAESARGTAESGRASAEATRVSNENTRKSNETARGTAETARVTAETARATAESARATAESGRATAESGRVTAEQGRVQAETAREEYFESVEDILDSKADVDGYYEQLTAGAADNLTGRGDGVGAEYIYRTAGGSADIADGTARINVIKGNTVVWNQHGRYAKIAQASVDVFGSAVNSWTVSQDGLKMSVENARVANFNFNAGRIYGHKVLLKFTLNVSGTFTNQMVIGFGGTYKSVGVLATGKNSFSIIGTMGTEFVPIYWYPNGTSDAQAVTCDYELSGFQVFDLTTLFGAGNEPATVEEFEALYPESYYPYNAGELLSVNVEGVETVGFNQWDEQWEVGGLNVNTGLPGSAVTTQIRSKNFISVFAGTEYFIGTPNVTNMGVYVLEYDGDKTYLGVYNYKQSANLTVGANTRFIKFYTLTQYGNVYKNDICINLSWSGYRNDEYEPYWEFEREIPVETYFPNGMRSAGAAYDELMGDKAITRIGAVDLGTLNWQYDSTNTRFYTVDLISVISKSGSGWSLNLKCAPYTTSVWTGEDKVVCQYISTGYVYIKDTAYTDAATFKTAMSGVTLYYELATPTETPIDPPLNLSYKVSDFGTERVMVPTGEMTAPVPMQIVYGLNAVDTLRRLPVQYISHASMAQFIAAIESHFNVTITETYDEDNERYDYTISAAQNGGE